jgi:hypothetical protein
MIPVPRNMTEKIIIDPLKDTYLMNEYRYLRKHWVEITDKSLSIYLERYDKNSCHYGFLTAICCDFKLLEEKSKEYNTKS